MTYGSDDVQLSLFGDDFGADDGAHQPTPDAQLSSDGQASGEYVVPDGVQVSELGRPVGDAHEGYDLVIATDGSCSGNPGPGGWAMVEQKTGYALSGGAKRTTNNIMELTAMKHALEYAGPDANILLRVDSKYVIDSMTTWAKGWKKRGWKKADGKPVLNRDLIEPIVNMYESRRGKTDVEWVRGHNGDAGNEMADSLAVAQTAKFAKN